MLQSLKEITGYTVSAVDGEMGKCDDFLFDDIAWIIRYAVIDTGNWLEGHDRVLIIPENISRPDWKNREIEVALSKKQIEKSPKIDMDKPVSRQQEIELHDFYKWTPYWVPDVYHEGPVPVVQGESQKEARTVEKKEHGDPHLRSVKEVIGYHVQALDGEIGHIDEMIADREEWIVRYLAVDTRNWLPGKKVLVAPEWVDKVSWEDRLVFFGVGREKIKNGPEYNPSDPVNRQLEERLYDYYGRPKYWF